MVAYPIGWRWYTLYGGIPSGDIVNIMLPLGNSFTIPASEDKNQKLLLIGGGVGTAPMLCLGSALKNAGFEPVFLLGARSKDDVLQLDEFAKLELFT